MNKAKRTRLEEASGLLSGAYNIVESVRNDEQSCMDNMPENLQYSSRYEEMESIVENLDEALDLIQSSIDAVDTVE